jgi:hypothetical protein
MFVGYITSPYNNLHHHINFTKEFLGFKMPNQLFVVFSQYVALAI